MAKKGDFIGFPEGRLREKPVRLPVLANQEDWFAVNKFAGILPQAHPWYSERPNLTSAIRDQISEGKGELKRLGVSNCHYIAGSECEFEGPSLFAKTKPSSDFLKNAFGSDQFLFRFWFLTPHRSKESEHSCELPVGAHKSEPHAAVTHRFGKKSSTRFRRLGESDHLNLWEATTSHPRLHQIRLHAAEVGLTIYGDLLYGSPDDESAFKSYRKHRAFNPRFSGLTAVLKSLDISGAIGHACVLEASIPKPLVSLLKKCGFHHIE